MLRYSTSTKWKLDRSVTAAEMAVRRRRHLDGKLAKIVAAQRLLRERRSWQGRCQGFVGHVVSGRSGLRYGATGGKAAPPRAAGCRGPPAPFCRWRDHHHHDDTDVDGGVAGQGGHAYEDLYRV